MEEKKKKKQEEKKKKEAAQKKAAEHKTKVPEPTKISQSQPQPANSCNSTSTTTITNSSGSNGKRASINCQQQALSRYPPREVPPRFRHQEQKQLLKRGQPLPPGTVVSNSLAQGTGQVAANSSQHSVQQASGGQQQLQHPGKGQTDLSHSGLATQYENSHWGQPPFRSEPNSIWDKVIIDGSDKEAWPSISGNETETASECTDTDSASNCGSDNSSMATGSAPGNFNGQNKNCNNGGNGALVQSSSNQSAIGGGANGGNGNSSRVWAVAPVSAPGVGHCSAPSGNGKMDSIVSVNPNCWSTSTSTAGINLNLNPNANPAAWPVVGQEIQGTVGGGSTSNICNPSNPIDQNYGNPNNGSAGTLNTWGNLLQQESTDTQTSTSQNVSFSIQPQNLNTDGPNNTNPINSSPNPINAMQANGLPNVSVPGGWAMTGGMGKINPSHLQNLSGGSGSSVVSQLSGRNGEGMNNPSCNSVWGVPHTNPTTTNSNSAFSQGNGDTVNSALSLSAKQTLANNSNNAVQKDIGNNAWDSGPPTSPRVLPWTRAGTIGGLHSGPSSIAAWGNTPSNRNTSNGVNGEWGKLSNQHSSNETNGNGKGWEGLCVNNQTPALQQGHEQINSLAKSSDLGATGSEGSNESAGSHHEGSTSRSGGRHGSSRRKADKGMNEQQGLVQSVMSKPDHDPRVLCNSGWGQTPVKQNISWEIQESPRSERKNDNGTEAWGSAAAQSSNSGARSDGSSMSSTNTSLVSGWGNLPPTVMSDNTGWGDKVSNSQGGWGDSANSTSAAAKSGHAWGGVSNQEEKPPSWADSQKPKSQNWGEGQKTNQGWTSGGVGVAGSGGGGDWTDTAAGPLSEAKKNGSSWENENNHTGPSWNETTRSQASGWSNGTNSKPSSNTGWGEPSKSSAPQNWGNKLQDNNLSNWGGAASVKQSNSGWVGGPLPAKQKDSEPTGWEEPSPPSIRRKIEIDDGTSAWGDPTNYKKTVNMWDRNNPVNQNSSNTVAEQPPQPHQSNATQNRSPLLGPGFNVFPGWGETLSVPTKTDNSWGEPPLPSTTVDNGTSAWGKPPNGSSSWADNSAESTGNFGRGNASATVPTMCKPASKSMQEGWVSGGDEIGLTSSHHSNWEEDDGEMGMWNNAASQESNSSCNSSGWGNANKKVHQKGMKASNKQEETWLMNRLIKQLTDMGFPREPAEEALKSNNLNLDQAMDGFSPFPGTLLEKKVELDKRGMGMSDYNGIVSKPLGCRPPTIPKESSMDRPTFFDKLTLSFSNQDGGLVEEPPTSPFLPSPSLKLALSNSAHPNQALGAIASGLGMQNLNSSRQSGNLGMFGNSGAAQARTMQQQPQPPVQPLNSSQPSLRAQVPQFLSPQVQAQLLQFAAKNMGLNPALLASPINPQHMTMLNQLYQLQLAYQRLLFQQQMLQAQRNVSGTIRQQEQQVARTINNMQQQIQQHQRQLTQALLMKQQPPHPPLHPSAGKVTIDNLSHHPSPSLSDLQTKEQQTSPNSFPAYSLAGLIPNMNVSNMELSGGLSMKDSAQAQSRLRQWTHPNSMENLSSNSLPLDQSQNKHEFRPGEPWKGLQNIDPETDPNVTPGSVPSGPSINTTIRDVDRYLLRDRSGGSSPTSSQNATLPSSSAWSFSASGYTSSFSSSTSAPNTAAKLTDKSTWSPGPIAQTQPSLSHELWKVPLGSKNTRPPPGLTNTKPSPSWGVSSLGLVSSWPSSYSSNSAWSTDSSGRNNSWLVLRNLTPQIDGSTLRTLCMQHGPLITFHLNLTQGNAVVRYSSKEEAAKAQKSLHMCVLGNTTILAEFASDEEVNRFFAQGQTLTQTSSWQSNTGTNQSRLGSSTNSHGLVRNDLGHWNTTSLSGKGANDLLWSGVPQYSSSLWGPPNSDDTRVIGSPTPINTLLPGDLLSGESM
ncbi:trinucleotide repeat-containing gene 6C protein isoform X10 [Stegostoma tigrinum]|uniref:trinucleotide repeat-containing gene 6C protein isoform X10 n=1 Tax=Stegostoma tigrinum TaxID=3053191 RepID=UPI0028703990|nr:trinucleotide repeat-containing gene 6C protein isoform X10 [Stegostoma tigrinum]